MRGTVTALLAGVAAVSAAQMNFYSFGEAFSLRVDEDSLQVSVRLHTAPSLTEFLATGVLVDRIEIQPLELRVAVGEYFSPSDFRVSTFGPEGAIAEHIPLTLVLEGPSDLLDFETWRIYGEEIRGASAGIGRIWVRSIAPSSSGTNAAQSILVVVY